MTKQDLIKKFEDALAQTNDRKIVGVALAIAVENEPGKGELITTVKMESGQVEQLRDHLSDILIESEKPVDNPIEELLRGIFGLAKNCPCPKCTARREGFKESGPKVEVMSPEEFFEMMKGDRNASGKPKPETKAERFNRKAKEARDKGMSMEEFADLLLAEE